jgi:hypothetical protein
MAIIKQGILGGFKKTVGSVVGSSWKGIATMRSLPLSVANPRTAAQVSNRNRFKACAEFASEILASVIKPLMDRFAGQMSGYNYFTKLNKEVFVNPSSPTWANLLISKGRMLAPGVTATEKSATKISVTWDDASSDKLALPTDKVYALVVGQESGTIGFNGDTGATRSELTVEIPMEDGKFSGETVRVYVAFLRADGSEVSNTGNGTFVAS